ncbi:substrate-binding protein domain-containing protein [Sporobacter termitidis DSM 10068]|uniref:Substrate-binding protein domain-containing protein n=1 Tax=Sporobacter termitidis DSM 10068 TaxID=1123282 RepID=A0A1M5Z9S8_9FIRM|nr:substrate-binding domain-containing protein [Sporobacter termitidis]SHI20981.1 substrate-binding protein domain-containing protein [Sporobacter termitidis DSM 10068]
MKKAISVMLAVLMVITLFACSGKGPATASPSAEGSATPSATPSDSASPSTDADISASENAVGFFKDGVDPASRKTYNVVWAYPRPMALMQNITDVLKELSTKLNYSVTDYCANNDVDQYVQNIQLFADQGADGYLCVIDPSASDRIKEVLDETGLPYIGVLNSVRDSSGSEIVPCVGIDGKAAGAKITQWLYDNYKTYFGDIDPAQIGFIDIDLSTNKDFHDRYEGAMEKFKELVPNSTHIYSADGVTGTMDADTGYNITAPIFTAHADVKYWFVASCLEMYAQGAARAAEGLKIDKNVMITTVGSDVLSAEWDAGYSGCWVSCLALSDYQYTIPAICGLVALMDGKATPDSLWSGKRASTDQFTFYNISNEMVTKDTYKAFFDSVKSSVG